MKIIYNTLIPFKGFTAINLFGVLFVREDCKEYLFKSILNHEEIHTAQMKELLYVGFYILYFVEWIIRLIVATKTAYSGISFEKEAYQNQNNSEYLKGRKKFSWVKYLVYFKDKVDKNKNK